MNKSTLILVAILFLTELSLTTYTSNTKYIHAESTPAPVTKKKIINPVKEIATAQKDLNSDYEKFIREANNKINHNEKYISKLQLKLTSGNKEANIEFSQKIESLRKSNIELKIKLDNYIKWGNGNWQTFKSELYDNLDELELACSVAAARDIKDDN